MALDSTGGDAAAHDDVSTGESHAAFSARQGVDVRALVVDLLDKHDGDVSAAAAEGARLTMQSPALFAALFEDKIRSTWHQLCSHEMRCERARQRRELRELGREPAQDPRHDASNARAQSTARTFFSWQLLIGGKRLGDATHEDLIAAVDKRRGHARTMLEEAEFLARLAEIVRPGAGTVSELCSEQQVREIFEAVRRERAA